MGRPRQRVNLNDGLKLDLNWLFRRGFVLKNYLSPPHSICWVDRFGNLLASGFVSADMTRDETGWLRVEIDHLEQIITLAGRARHFGGQQWYFVCPYTERDVSVLWKPPGANNFGSRFTWAEQVAYITQFGSLVDRAHLGKAKIVEKISFGAQGSNLTFPPKPTGMHWKTYNEHLDRYRKYERVLNYLGKPPPLE